MTALVAVLVAGCAPQELPLTFDEARECRAIVEAAGSFAAFEDQLEELDIDVALLTTKYLDHYRPALAAGMSAEEATEEAWLRFVDEPPVIRWCRALLEDG